MAVKDNSGEKQQRERGKHGSQGQQWRVWYESSIRRWVDSMGECAKLKTVTLTEIKQSSARDTFIAENVYLELFFLWDWKPAERLKQTSQKSDGVSFTLSEDDASSTGRPERTQLQVGVWQEWRNLLFYAQSTMMVISGWRHDRLSEATSLIVVLMERYFRTELMWHSWFVSNILMIWGAGTAQI